MRIAFENRARSVRLPAVLLVAVAASCTYGNAIDVTDAPEARTSQSSYAVPAGAPEIQIPVTFTNRTGGVLYLDGVGRDLQAVEKLVDGTWRVAYQPVYTMQAAVPLPLAAGESWQLTVSLNLQPGTEPRFQEPPPGRYRLVFGYAPGPESTPQTVRSNEFQLVESN